MSENAVHSTPVLSIEGLSKSFGRRTVWSDISHSFSPGTLTALVGPSGGGKTTLLNCISLLEPADAGVVRFDGEPVGRGSRRRLYRKHFGFVFQNHGLVDQDSVRANLLLSPQVRSRPRRFREQAIAAMLAEVGLEGREQSPVFELSGGEQQRVAIARVFLHGARVLFADEPTASLDDANADVVIGLMLRFAEAGGIVIAATHDQRLRAAAGDALAVGREA